MPRSGRFDATSCGLDELEFVVIIVTAADARSVVGDAKTTRHNQRVPTAMTGCGGVNRDPDSPYSDSSVVPWFVVLSSIVP